MNKYVLLGIFIAIFVAGVAVIFGNQSVSFTDAFGSLNELSPRVLSLLALPVIAILFVLGVFFHKKREERMWKSALMKTREKKAQ